MTPNALASASTSTACPLPVSRPRELPVAEGVRDTGRCGDRPRDPGPDEALRQIKRVPGGAGHLGLLDTPDLGRRPS